MKNSVSVPFAQAAGKDLLLKLSLLVVILLLCGCPRHRPPVPEASTEPPVEPRVVEVGEVVEFEFPATGSWYTSDFLALPDQQLIVRPVGVAAQTVGRAILFKMHNYPQIADPANAFSVTSPGRIQCRLDRRLAPPGIQGTLIVEIERLK